MTREDLTRSLRDYYANCQQRFKDTRPVILKIMNEAKITHVSVCYSGSGDSGCVDLISTEPKGIDLTVPVIVDGKSIRPDQLLEDYVYDALTIHHDGWENNDGASGELVWDIAADTVDLNHYSYYTESEYTGTEL